jgi:hypothetical protein
MDVYMEIYTSKFTPSTRDALRRVDGRRGALSTCEIPFPWESISKYVHTGV